MKNAFVIYLLAAYSCCFAQGQLQKGMVLIGSSTNLVGNLSSLTSIGTDNNAGIQFGKSKSKYESSGFSDESETTIMAFNLNPTIGFLVTNNLMVGLNAGVFVYNEKNDDEEDGFTILSVSPMVRAYFKNEGKVLPFAEVRGGIASLKYKDNDDDKESVPFLGIKAGGAIFLNSKTSLDLFADYFYAKDSEDLDGGGKSTQTQGLFGLGLGLSVFL